MSIIFNDYTHIVEFIAENKGRYSEGYIAGIVKHEMETEFASEMAIDAVMLQAQPRSIIGKRLIEHYGSTEAAMAAIPSLTADLNLAHEIVPELKELLASGLLRSSRHFI